MNTRKLVISLIFLVAVFLAACSPQAEPSEAMTDQEVASADAVETMEDKNDAMLADKSDDLAADSDEAMLEEKEDDMMSDEEGEKDDHQDDTRMDDKKDDSMMEEKGDEMAAEAMMVPGWFEVTLSNANSGETFKVADLKGKVILVETLAMWCSNCLKQQTQVKALHDLIGERDDFVSLGVDIDPNENATALQAYTDKNGFDWLYTVAPVEVSRELGLLYGDQYLNPPSTPMFIIDRQGEVHLLPFGIKSAESLLEALQPFLDSEI